MTAPALFDLPSASVRPVATLAEARLQLVYGFQVYGRPAPQGSKKAWYDAKHQRVRMREQSADKIKDWRADVKDAAQAVYDSTIGLLNEALVADFVFTTTRPSTHYRTGRNAHLLRDNAPPRPISAPDLSKLARSTEDALTGVLWLDDSRVTGYGRLLKVFAGEDVDALDRPGAVIRIYRWERPA